MTARTPLAHGALAALAVLLSGALVSALPGCGKDLNTHPKRLLEFPNALPLSPRPMVEPDHVPPWTSGHALTVDGDRIWVADRDNGALVVLDRGSLEVVATVDVGERPEQVVVGPDGHALTTVRGTGDVVRISPSFEIVARAHVGTEPHGIALSSDGTSAYVTLLQQRRLLTLDAETLAERGRVETLPLPRAVAVSPLGWALVVHQSDPAMTYPIDADGLPEVADSIPAELRRGNPADFMSGRRIDTLHPTRALAAAVLPEGGGALVVHVQAAPGSEEEFVEQAFGSIDGEVSATSDGYGSSGGGGADLSFDIPTRPIETSVTAVAPSRFALPADADFPVQDLVTGEPMAHLVDQPSDIRHHPTWTLAFVTGYGSDNVLVLNTAVADPMRSPLAIIDVGRAPRGIAVSEDGQMAYVLNDQEVSVSAIDLTPLMSMTPVADDGRHPSVPQSTRASSDFEFAPQQRVSNLDLTKPIRLKADHTATFASDPWPEVVRRGQRTFTFARNERISHAGTFACASCHYEGAEDKLVWFITDGPRQTPSLAGRLADTAPFNWSGSKGELQDNMVQTIGRMGGDGLKRQELADLEQFLLHGLVAPPNPNVAGGLTPRQLEGKALFEDEEVGCAGCHKGASMTDGAIHEVGTANESERLVFDVKRDMGAELPPNRPGFLNTPTLRGLHYTAPYLHDGSAPTLYDVFDRTADTMGKTSHLTDDQKDALVAYLLTL